MTMFTGHIYNRYRARRALGALLLMALLLMAAPVKSHAQQFSVEGFRTLPNDVSAFITPVLDLNDEACALIKVPATEEFAFSSPLGIVKRRDDVGEIWLYLPRGTRFLTIKHPRWGVLRDYRLPKALESRVTYELTLTPPEQPILRDTIVVTQTRVDTVALAPTRRKRPPLPWTTHVLLTSSLHRNGPSWGIMLAVMRHHGLFAHVATDFRSTGDNGRTCQRNGAIGGSSVVPYYTGHTRHADLTLTAGAIHRLCPWLSLFEGVGYGRTATSWQLADSEGGGYVLNEGLTHKGVAGELGLMGSFGRLSVSASALTVKGKAWQASIGIGLKLGKQ